MFDELIRKKEKDRAKKIELIEELSLEAVNNLDTLVQLVGDNEATIKIGKLIHNELMYLQCEQESIDAAIEREL